jgi:group I intron endonuclease
MCIPGVYIYKLNIKNNIRYYVGSSIKLVNRTQEHRLRAKVWWDKNRQGSNGSPVFYNSVNKYGWNNFKFGILKYLDMSSSFNMDTIKILLETEQYYLDNINPSLNICKIAKSSLGIKRNVKKIK